MRSNVDRQLVIRMAETKNAYRICGGEWEALETTPRNTDEEIRLAH